MESTRAQIRGAARVVFTFVSFAAYAFGLGTVAHILLPGFPDPMAGDFTICVASALGPFVLAMIFALHWDYDLMVYLALFGSAMVIAGLSWWSLSSRWTLGRHLVIGSLWLKVGVISTVALTDLVAH